MSSSKLIASTLFVVQNPDVFDGCLSIAIQCPKMFVIMGLVETITTILFISRKVAYRNEDIISGEFIFQEVVNLKWLAGDKTFEILFLTIMFCRIFVGNSLILRTTNQNVDNSGTARHVFYKQTLSIQTLEL